MSIYENEEYAQHNATWHVEDSPWKAGKLLALIRKNGLEPRSVCEVGCGAGEILVQLYNAMPDTVRFTGYDISPQVVPMWEERRRDRIDFVHGDFLAHEETYDIVMLVDIIEHIEDYIGFLRQIKPRAEYKLFNFPLELFAVKAAFGRLYTESRSKYGHLHYFNRDICLAVLGELGYEVVDTIYAESTLELASVTTSLSMKSRLLNLPRFLFSKISPDFTAKVFGGYSLFVLAK